MGIFDFFKKKPADKKVTPSSAKTTATTNKTATAATPKPQPRPAATQQRRPVNNPSSPKPAQPKLTQRERYGKASLIGYQQGDWATATVEFRKLEAEGFGEASIALGQMAQQTSKTQALVHFRKAAAAGLAEGQWGVAAILGHEYVADVAGKDKEWYEYCLKSAQGGCGDAMHELGKHYHHKGDYLAAYYWFQLASWYECQEANYSVAGLLMECKGKNLGALSTSIDGVPATTVRNVTDVFNIFMGKKNLDNAFIDSFMLKSLANNDEFLALFFGHFFEEVVKMDGNSKMAYQFGAHAGSIMGMKCLGDMLAYGKGCERSLEKAFSWYRPAADKGEKTSCFIMGQVTRQNKNEAAYWFSAALRRGYEPAYEALMKL